MNSTGAPSNVCREPKDVLVSIHNRWNWALSNSPAAPSNFCREPQDALVSIHDTFKQLLKMQLGSLEFSCGSLKFLPGAQRCTGFYMQHLS